MIAADRAARHARCADQRRAACELYKRTRQEHGVETPSVPLPWMSDDPPPLRV